MASKDRTIEEGTFSPDNDRRYYGTDRDAAALYDAANDRWVLQTRDAAGALIDRLRVKANQNALLAVLWDGTNELNLAEATTIPAHGALVVASDAPAAVRAAAQEAKTRGQNVYLCDGTDDQSEIQSAINSLSSGGTVLLSQGTFTISSNTSPSITITTSKIELVIPQGATLQWASGGTTPQRMIQVGDGSTTVSDVTIRGKGTLNGNGQGTGTHGLIHLTGPVRRCRIEGLHLTNNSSGDAIWIEGAADTDAGRVDHVLIRNVVLTNVGEGIVWLNAHHVSVIGCHIDTVTSQDAIEPAQSGSRYWVVANNVIRNVQQSGIDIFQCSDGIAEGNYIQDAAEAGTDSGITIQASRVIVRGNTIRFSNWKGIYVGSTNQLEDIVIEGNVVIGDSLSTSTREGIQVEGPDSNPGLTRVRNIAIIGNLVEFAGYSGIVIEADGCVLIGNVARDNCVNLTANAFGIKCRLGSRYVVIGNQSYNLTTTNQLYGIQMSLTSNALLVANMAWSNTSQNFLIQGGSTTAAYNHGYTSENGGQATFSGNGTTTTFNIAHGLATTPDHWEVTPASANAASAFYVTADATNLTVTFSTAPPTGTNNVVLSWRAWV